MLHARTSKTMWSLEGFNVSTRNSFDWYDKYNGSFASFVNGKVKQFVNKNSESLDTGLYFLDFDFEESKFYFVSEDGINKVFVGRKVK